MLSKAESMSAPSVPTGEAARVIRIEVVRSAMAASTFVSSAAASAATCSANSLSTEPRRWDTTGNSFSKSVTFISSSSFVLGFLSFFN